MELIVCPNCGEENPAKFRLCGFCGTALAPALPPQELRKTVTIVFSDLKGSTNLGEALDPESLREVMTRYFDSMKAVLDLHGGTIEKYIGDAIMAVFGLPRLHEDDALRAVRAAHGMQQALRELNTDLLAAYGVELTNRTGVNTGEVVAGDVTTGQRLVTGDAVNTAARLEQAAPANEVLIGELTYELVRGQVDVEAVEPLELKGKAERVAAYRLVGVGEGATLDREESPLVGRDRELAILEETLADAYVTQRCRLVTVVGEPGVGKSRLIHEFLEEHDADAVTLRGRCLSYGDAITFWPIVEAVRMAAEVAEDDTAETAQSRILELLDPDDPERDQIVARVAAAIGLTAAQVPVSELFWGIRRLFEALAADQPLIVLFDDIHDAAPTFLELLDHLVESSKRVPIVLVCSARHELLEQHPEWEGKPGTATIKLEPLTAADAEVFIDRLLGDTALPDEVRRRVIEAAEGNPLYVEQMVRMLADERVGSASDISEFVVPPSIQALIAARLDLLSREERAIVEPASVIGLVFPEPAVHELVPETLKPALGQHLTTLSRKQFVRQADGGMAADDSDTYRFHHILIRDTAYNALLKRARATLHERFVAWAEQVNRERDREQEFEEILGYHLEQAFRYRAELGPIDAEGRQIGTRAAQRLGAAGRRAFARGDLPAATNLLARAAALREDRRSRANRAAGGSRRGPAGAGRLCRGHRDASTRLRRRRPRSGMPDWKPAPSSTSGTSRSMPATQAPARARSKQLRMRFRSSKRPAIAQDWHAPGGCGSWSTGRRAGMTRRRRRPSASSSTPLPPATRGWRRVAPRSTRRSPWWARFLRRKCASGASGSGRRSQATAKRKRSSSPSSPRSTPCRATSSAPARNWSVNGRCSLSSDRASPPYRRSIERARVESLAGDLAAAERELRADDAALAALDERYFRSTVVGMLAGVLVEVGRFEDAAAAVETARELADEDDALSQVLWRTAHARLLAEADKPDEAVAEAESAVALATDGDDIDLLGDVKSALGEVLWRAGRRDMAEPPLREALALYERKEDVASASRVRLRLEALASGADPTAVG